VDEKVYLVKVDELETLIDEQIDKLVSKMLSSFKY
jgi:hypothetical protein